MRSSRFFASLVLCACADGVVPVTEPEGEVVVFAAVPGENPEGQDVLIVGEPSQGFYSFATDVELTSAGPMGPPLDPKPAPEPTPPKPPHAPKPAPVPSPVEVPPPTPEPVSPVPVESHEDHSIQQEVYERTREVDQVTSDSLEVLNKLRMKKHLPPLPPTPLDIPEVPPVANAPAPPSKD